MVKIATFAKPETLCIIAPKTQSSKLNLQN
jgi:hypothetical protein